MHRSNFRLKRPDVKAPSREAPKAAPPDTFQRDIKEQIENLIRDIAPVKAGIASLSAPKAPDTVPADIAQSLRLIHNRLDRLERGQAEIESQAKRMATTFSNAILKLADKVEKIAGVEDSSFSLAHSLEQLVGVLTNRRLRIIRDGDGNMAAVEPESASFSSKDSE